MSTPWFDDLRGRKFGHLTAESRAPNRGRKTAWECACDCGNRVTVLADNLKRGLTSSCGCSRRQGSPRLTYSGAHSRVRRLRGPANCLTCADCEQSAVHWSYDHSDPDEITDPRGRPYSEDPRRYVPRCVSCHKLHDLHQAPAETSAGESLTQGS